MRKLVETETELAALVGHELAARILGYVDKKRGFWCAQYCKIKGSKWMEVLVADRGNLVDFKIDEKGELYACFLSSRDLQALRKLEERSRHNQGETSWKETPLDEIDLEESIGFLDPFEMRVNYGHTHVLVKKIGAVIHVLDLFAEGQGRRILTNAIEEIQPVILKTLNSPVTEPKYYIWVLYHTDATVTQYSNGAFYPLEGREPDRDFYARMVEMYGEGTQS